MLQKSFLFLVAVVPYDALFCLPENGKTLFSPNSAWECGNLQRYDCCRRCSARKYTSGCIAVVWNTSGCCTYHQSQANMTSKAGSVLLVGDWAPAPTPPTPGPPIPPTPPPSPPPPPPPSPSPTASVPCGRVTHNQTTWEIDDLCLLTCATDACTYSFDTIIVHPGGELLIDERVSSTTIYVRIFAVLEFAKLTAGTKEAPFPANFEIVLTGKSSDQDDPGIPKWVLSHGAGSLPYSKVLLGGVNSSVRLHGLPKKSWIKLAKTAKVGSSTIELTEAPLGWQVGDQLIVPSTGWVKTQSGSGENEVVTLKRLDGTTLTIEEILQFEHVGDEPDVRLNGEVGVLTHNIRIRGDNTDEEYASCLDTMTLGFDKANLPLVRARCYGGHTASLTGSTWQLSNVELRRMGQATRIARYPIHWHLAGDQSLLNSYATGNSIWETFQRCLTIHGTWGVTVEENVCFQTRGHAFYLEDAIEHNNRFVRNLVVGVLKGPMVCTDQQVGPSGFWITNPNNSFIDNLVVDAGNHYGGVGYWFVAVGDYNKETGPLYIGADFWTDDFTSKVSGAVFDPSASVFGPNASISERSLMFPMAQDPQRPRMLHTAVHAPAPSWMLGQQQGRTPLKEFRGNGVRGSFKGVHFDGFVTSSVPGQVGDVNETDPEDLHVFGEKDGTCNYFPKGDLVYQRGEGVHVYVPMTFTYDDAGRAHNFSPTWSIIDGLHVSRCFVTWWSRAARVNITNSIFAHNWVGMTNHNPGMNYCPGEGSPLNPGLASHISKSLFIGYGDEVVNRQLCSIGSRIMSMYPDESPAGLRQYDATFWLSDSHWMNMSTVACPADLQYDTDPDHTIKTLPYALVAARQWDCNGKFPILLYNSWPLGASPTDADGKWAWAWAHRDRASSQNLAQFTGSASCTQGPSGGVTDMTGTLDPLHPSVRTAYFPVSGAPANPGELATYSEEDLRKMSYALIPATANANVASFAWSSTIQEEPDNGHICGYCFYDEKGNCHLSPPGVRKDFFV